MVNFNENMEYFNENYLEIVKPLLNKLGEDYRSVLPDSFVGLYVFGSINTKAWDPKTSDIDFFVVTEEPLNEKEMESLIEINDKYKQEKWFDRLEGEFYDIQSLRKKDYSRECLIMEEGNIEISGCKISHDNLYNLVENGVVILGKPIEKLGISVSKNELKHAVWEMIVEDRDELVEGIKTKTISDVDRGGLLINVLRSIFTLENEKLPTKKDAIELANRYFSKNEVKSLEDIKEGLTKKLTISNEGIIEVMDYGVSLYSE